MKWTPMLYTGDMVRALVERLKRQTRRPVMMSGGKGLRDVPLHVRYPNATQMPREEWGKEQRHLGRPIASDRMFPFYPGIEGRSAFALSCPWGVVGDRIWVRESIWCDRRDDGVVVYSATPELAKYRRDDRYIRASFPDTPITHERPTREEMAREMRINANWRQRPSIHMPRWASRITLELNVAPRIERLQDIDYSGAIAEGVDEWGHDKRTERERDEARNRTAVESYRLIWDSCYGKSIGDWNVNPWVWVLTFSVHVQRLEAAA